MLCSRQRTKNKAFLNRSHNPTTVPVLPACVQPSDSVSPWAIINSSCPPAGTQKHLSFLPQLCGCSLPFSATSPPLLCPRLPSCRLTCLPRSLSPNLGHGCWDRSSLPSHGDRPSRQPFGDHDTLRAAAKLATPSWGHRPYCCSRCIFALPVVCTGAEPPSAGGMMLSYP